MWVNYQCPPLFVCGRAKSGTMPNNVLGSRNGKPHASSNGVAIASHLTVCMQQLRLTPCYSHASVQFRRAPDGNLTKHYHVDYALFLYRYG